MVTMMRRKRATGHALWGPWGKIIMDILEEEVTDTGAPEFAVTGIKSVERISIGQIRITKYSRRKDGCFVTHHEVWDYHIWQKQFENLENIARIMSQMAIPPDGHEEQRRSGKH